MMKILLDTNIFLEIILEQEKAQEARELLSKAADFEFFVSDYAIHSVGLLLFRRGKHEAFNRFLIDMFHNAGVRLVSLSPEEMESIFMPAQQFHLDFDDAYQYVIAEQYGFIIASFDADFDRTARGRKTPIQILFS